MNDDKKVDPSWSSFPGSANEPQPASDKPQADPKGAEPPKHPYPRDEEHSRKRSK